ncbi:hypothetical protein [Portibacter marinus]|uniref:hypothetical protein n=1 Tax=Portibacter marinus TaxID=2898660 RepID=UPI001F3D8F76|nr:hypothetical protein [Portibacter marinus]
MENKSFDDIIKSKLSQFSIENDAQAWDAFQESQDAHTFDEQLKDKVVPHEVDVPNVAWESFAEKSGMISFDEHIREKLVHFNSEEVPQDFDSIGDRNAPKGFDALIGAKLAELNLDGNSDWDQFEKILEGEEVFDERVKQKVEDFEVPYNGAQWPKLSEHLEKIEKRRRRILITKFIEAAVFILFILTIMQLYPIQNLTKKPVYRTHGVAEAVRQSGNSNATDHQNVQGREIDQINGDQKSSNVSLANIKTSPDASVESISTLENSPTLIADNERSANDDSIIKSLSSLPTIFRHTDNPLQSQRSFGIERTSGEKIIADLEAIDTDEPEHIAFERKEIRLNANKDDYPGQQPALLLASLDIPRIEAERRNFSIPFKGLASQLKNGQHWFNLYGSPQINMINTPFDKSYSVNRFINTEEGVIEAYSHLAEGYTVGASISKESAAWEVEGGIEYTSLNYYPKQITERVSNATVGYKDILLKEIIFDLVEIPLNIKYSLFKKKGWKVYGVNGASVGVVAFANYDIEEKETKPLASAMATPNQNRNPGTFVDRKDFDEGFVKSRNFLNNAYTTVNIGVGVSKEISDQMSFYIQPTYYHNLSQSGIGPNNDVHHRLALQIGTKVRI